MARTNSPLRYPGGKSCLIDLTVEMLSLNGLERCHYAEPYAGGCGLALSLLYGGFVSDIHINDIDPAVWAFWHCALNENEALVDLVATTPVTIQEWARQRSVLRAGDCGNLLELGFSAFFLNRTNRSGIIKGAGAIGGLEQQGNYKIDCRFNREDLIRRISRIKKYNDRIHLTRMDAQDFILSEAKRLPELSLFFIDPPYFSKGADLYTSYYNASDHADIAKTVGGLQRPWVMTYDDVAEIRDIYRMNRQYSFSISYSLREKRQGSELLIPSKRFHVPKSLRANLVNRPQYRSAV